MTAEKNIWHYEELEGRWDELFRRAAAGEPQRIVDAAGRSFTVLVGSEAPSALAAFRNIPRGEELTIERLRDLPRDVEL